jgi:hypothetical protein
LDDDEDEDDDDDYDDEDEEDEDDSNIIYFDDEPKATEEHKDTKEEEQQQEQQKGQMQDVCIKSQIIATNIEPFLFEDHRMVNIAISGKLGFHFKTGVTSLRKRKFTYCRHPPQLYWVY